VTYSRPKPDIIQLDAEGGTIGFARTLWRLDATHTARARLSTLRPIDVRQSEVYRSETVRTSLDFDDEGVVKLRETKPVEKTAKAKRFDQPNLYDLNSAVLFLRSQKLQPGQTFNFVAYPATAAYLATVRVGGREKLKVRAGTFPAIKLDLRLQKIGKDWKLEPHSKFKRASAWLSDDRDRLVLKVEGEIFVGSVWAELTSVKVVPEL